MPSARLLRTKYAMRCDQWQALRDSPDKRKRENAARLMDIAYHAMRQAVKPTKIPEPRCRKKPAKPEPEPHRFTGLTAAAHALLAKVYPQPVQVTLTPYARALVSLLETGPCSRAEQLAALFHAKQRKDRLAAFLTATWPRDFPEELLTD